MLGVLAMPSRERLSLVRPLAAEHFDGGAGHVHVVVLLRPVQLQVAAGQVGDEPEPRSQTRTATSPGRLTRTNSALVRRGNAACRSTCGPTPSTRSSVTAST